MLTTTALADINDYTIRRQIVYKTDCKLDTLTREIKTEGTVDFFATCENVSFYPDGLNIHCDSDTDETSCVVKTDSKDFDSLTILSDSRTEYTADLEQGTVESLAGKKTVFLLNQSGEKLNIATIDFRSEGSQIHYDLVFNEASFQQEFLSMRPFKCIHAKGKLVCHLPYSYEKQGYITSDDFTDLEYDFMFLHKTPEEYGINPWNGLYYTLELDENFNFSGELSEVDLNVLVAPPKAGDLRPVTRNMLHPANPKKHVFPKILIE